MAKTRSVQVRFTVSQHELLKQYTDQRGFQTLAAYIRFAVFEHDHELREKIVEIHQLLVNHLGLKEPRRYRRR